MNKLNIVKIGGNVIDDEAKLDEFLAAFGQLEGLKLLVHGGGKIATQLAGKLGIETQMVEGRRITSEEMVDVVVMCYGGLVNKKIVAKLQASGVDAMGFSGADGNLILADKRPPLNGIDYGWVGDLKEVKTALLRHEFEMGHVPVVAPLSHDGKGNLLNTNADTIASTLAVALSVHFDVSLNFCFELKGVMLDLDDPDSVIKDLTKVRFEELKEDGAINEGMIPKLTNAFKAIDEGVSAVRILHFQHIGTIDKKTDHDFTLIH